MGASMSTHLSSQVLLIGRRMRREVIEQIIASQPDIHVVGSCDGGGSLSSEVERTGATIVVATDGSDDLERSCFELLRSQPRVRALALYDEGRASFLYELRPHRVPLGALSPESLIESLRPENRTWSK